jgi:Antibiotic biosynthesis monooxygenase
MKIRYANEQIDGRKSAFDFLLPANRKAGRDGLEEPVWNVRAVGFISKPERTAELAVVIETSLNDLLREFPGFAGAMVLRSQNETRNLLVLSFWETEKQAAATRWEENRAVRLAIWPIVDVCTKVQTFRATAARSCGEVNSDKPASIFSVGCA